MRDTRLQFIAFGLLPALNALALFIHSIFIVTGTTGGAGAALVVTLLALLVMLIAVVLAGVRRARDLGWSGTTTTVVFGLAFLLVMPIPLLLAWLCFAPGKDGVPPEPTAVERVLRLVLLLAMPWMLILVARALG